VGEFDLIARYFTHPPRGAWPSQGVGDDCALIDLPGVRIAVSCDMLIAGRHFLPDDAPEAIGHKALAVNLSDLAAAGAAPRACFLALGLPEADEAWLARFAAGLHALADAHGCPLLGGDTTRTPPQLHGAGPLTLSVTVLGELPPGQGLTRAGARPGDDLWVSGELGDAALALAARSGAAVLGPEALVAVRARLDRPQPRVALGRSLRTLATSAIDVSDGLAADLGHVLTRSGVGATLLWPAVPRSSVLRAQPEALQRDCALAGGDDYELLFTAPARQRDAVVAAARAAGVAVSRLGTIRAEPGLEILDAAGARIELARRGYDHFAS
jgi:thiamine-monophosphate kinase